MERGMKIIFLFFLIVFVAVAVFLIVHFRNKGEVTTGGAGFAEVQKKIENALMQDDPSVLDEATFSRMEQFADNTENLRIVYLPDDPNSIYSEIIILYDLEKEEIISIEKREKSETEQETITTTNQSTATTQTNTTKTTTESGEETVEEEYYLFNELKVDPTFEPIGEGLDSVKPFLDKNDLPNFLRDLSLKDNLGTNHQYAQKIDLGEKIIPSFFRDTGYTELVGLPPDTWIFGFKILPNTHIFNYTIEFGDSIARDNLVGSEIYLFNQKFTIVGATIDLSSITLESTKGNRLSLSSENEIFLNEAIRLPEIRTFLIKTTEGNLKKIIIQWKQDEEGFIAQGADLVFPLFNVLKFTFEGLTSSADGTFIRVALRPQEAVEPAAPEIDLTLPTTGDNFIIERATRKLTIGASLKEIFSAGIGDDQMPNFLRDMDYVACISTQRIEFSEGMILSTFTDQDYEALAGVTPGTEVTGFKILQGAPILNYSLLLYDSNTDESRNDEGRTIFFFGRAYKIDFVTKEPILSVGLVGSEGAQQIFITLEDNKPVEINGAEIDSLTAFVDISYHLNELELITLEWKASEKIFLTEDVELIIPGFETLKFTFEGMTSPEGEDPYGTTVLSSI